jgi:hypothetical protein
MPDPLAVDAERLAVWSARWKAGLTAARIKGQDDSTGWGPGRVVIGPPATDDELRAIEGRAEVVIPDSLRRLFGIARSVESVWHFRHGIEPPRPFHDIFAGACIWSLEGVPAELQDYREWLNVAFPEGDADLYDPTWHGKFPLLHAPNDDRIALDVDESVVYLSHDDGEGHGYRLADDVFQFLDAWTSLGCPGPEDWQWLAFRSTAGSGLDPDGENGKAWRSWFGLA